MNYPNSGLAHGTNGSPQLNLENGDAERIAAENERMLNLPVSLPTNDSQLKHIFRDSPGHLKDTPHNRQVLLRLAQDDTKYKGTDKYGNAWNVEITHSGKQRWVRYRDGVINEGGENNKPKQWDNTTGLNYNPFRRKTK